MQKTDALQQVRFSASTQLKGLFRLHQFWLCRGLKEKSVGKELGSLFREFVIGVIYIYFRANIHYYISMKGDPI